VMIPREPAAEWVPDWEEEARTDRHPRSPEHIARLLKFETTPEMTTARILNDKMRVLHQRGFSVFSVNQQAAIVAGRQIDTDGEATWVKR